MKGIHADRLEAWLGEHVDGLRPPLRFELIAGGHSNLTYRVDDADGRRIVLRRPPTGAVLATAHDMAREHRIISALADTAVPVAPALGLCEDERVNDAPFYLMEYVEGIVLTRPEQTDRAIPPDRREVLGLNVIETLAHLHSLEPDDVGLGDLGRREAYLARQLRRWRGQLEKTRTRELPAMEAAHDALVARMPEQYGASIVHGDYRLGNMLVDPATGGIAAVLDWELCTLGDAMADLGYLMNDWLAGGEQRPTTSGVGRAPTACGGFPDRRRLLEHYEALTGRDTRDVDYYRAFQYWRAAAIVEGVLSRYEKGVMAEQADTESFRERVDALADCALELLRGERSTRDGEDRR